MTTLELRPLSTGEILDGSLTILRRHFGLLFGLAVICQGVPTALDAYLEVAGAPEQHVGLALLSRLIGFFGSLLVSGGTVGVVSEVYLGRQPRLGDALRLALDKMGVVFGAGLLAGIVTALATLALVIPGIIVFCGYSVVVQAAVLEQPPSAGSALGRSWELTKGFKGKALGLWAVAVAILVAVFIAVGVATEAAAAVVSALEVPALVVISAFSLISYPLIGCIFTLFYYDLRVRKEGFDLDMLSRSLA